LSAINIFKSFLIQKTGQLPSASGNEKAKVTVNGVNH